MGSRSLPDILQRSGAGAGELHPPRYVSTPSGQSGRLRPTGSAGRVRPVGSEWRGPNRSMTRPESVGMSRWRAYRSAAPACPDGGRVPADDGREPAPGQRGRRYWCASLSCLPFASLIRNVGQQLACFALALLGHLGQHVHHSMIPAALNGADRSLAVSDANRPRHCEFRVGTSVGTGEHVSRAAIFFDVDGTMLDDDADWRSAVAATAGLIADRYPPLSREELVSAPRMSSRHTSGSTSGTACCPTRLAR